MTRSDLIKRLAAANPHLYARDLERIVDTVFEQIGSALTRGDRVELRGFGMFSTRGRGERVGRNPRTGAEVAVPGKACAALQGRQRAARAPQPPPRSRREIRARVADRRWPSRSRFASGKGRNSAGMATCPIVADNGKVRGRLCEVNQEETGDGRERVKHCNDRVWRQACFQAVLVRSMALSVTTSLRMQAVSASLAGFPARRSRR